MIRLSKILVAISFLFSMYHLHAQSTLPFFSGFPLKQGDSPLFGKDIIIHDQPDQDQRNVAICSAFNGWLFSVNSYVNETYNMPAYTIMRSIDNGIIWSVLFDETLPVEDYRFKSMDIIATGDSVSNLKVIFAGFITHGSNAMGEALILRFNGQTGEFEEKLFEDFVAYDIALASDFNYPANNSNPSTVGVLYSKYSNVKDSLIFLSSSNGGMSLDGRQVVALTGNRFHKVALAYGRSASWSSGRYFAAWEEQAAFDSITGHIFTAHTNPNYNSPFSIPVNLDSLDASNINKIRNPAIACQYNDVDNDSSNLSEIVLFEKYNQSNQRNDVRGYYNLQAANHSKFKKLNISDSLHNNLQPDISFNPYDSTFMVTYYDSTQQKLPFLVNNYNLRIPNTWEVISPSYNDSSNLSAPYPKVEISSNSQTGVNVWISDGTGGHGVAMFDSPSSTWTGVSETRSKDGTRLIDAYPNPCNNELNISFELKNTGKVSINVLSALGQNLVTVTNQYYSEGKHIVRCDVSKFATGSYLFKFYSGDGITTNGKFFITR